MHIGAWNAITAFGDLIQTWRGLLDGRTISGHTRVPVAGDRDRVFNIARRVVCADRFGQLSTDTALIVGTSKGPIEEWLHTPTSDNPSGGISICGLADVAARLGDHLKLSGPRVTVSAACASGLHAFIRAALLIQHRECAQALVVATESSLHPLFIGSFNRLGILARPGDGAKPFDEFRKGFFMSEAAAAILLRASDPDEKRTAKLISLERFALGGDASHLIGVDPQAGLLKHLLTNVVSTAPIDLIAAHGTGTILNDAAELAALEAVISEQDSPPILYSHKAALGHSLGASGLLSVVINCQCHSEAMVPPNPNTTHPLLSRGLVIPNSAIARAIRRSAVIATGFGGPTAVVTMTSA